MKKIFILVLLFVFVTGCSTMRLEYKADITKEDGKNAQYTFTRSYPVGGATETLCYITAIVLGGVCWYYLAMPTVDQGSVVENDALASLNNSIGNKYKIVRKEVNRLNWREEADQARLTNMSSVTPSTVEVKTK